MVEDLNLGLPWTNQATVTKKKGGADSVRGGERLDTKNVDIVRCVPKFFWYEVTIQSHSFIYSYPPPSPSPHFSQLLVAN